MLDIKTDFVVTVCSLLTFQLDVLVSLPPSFPFPLPPSCLSFFIHFFCSLMEKKRRGRELHTLAHMMLELDSESHAWESPIPDALYHLPGHNDDDLIHYCFFLKKNSRASILYKLPIWECIVRTCKLLPSWWERTVWMSGTLFCPFLLWQVEVLLAGGWNATTMCQMLVVSM